MKRPVWPTTRFVTEKPDATSHQFWISHLPPKMLDRQYHQTVIFRIIRRVYKQITRNIPVLPDVVPQQASYPRKLLRCFPGTTPTHNSIAVILNEAVGRDRYSVPFHPELGPQALGRFPHRPP